MDDQLLASLARALEAAPGDSALRLHYAELLDAAGRHDDAVSQKARVLQDSPADPRALAVITGGTTPHVPPTEEVTLSRLDAELADVVAPRLPDLPTAQSTPAPAASPTPSTGTVAGVGGPLDGAPRSTVRLSDVAGMLEVKERLEAAVLAPMRNPELGRLYGSRARGGLLLYGPPGCGKTFLAQALAGELGGAFLSVTMSDVLDMWMGQSERNLHEIFETARRNAPCVVFLDEIDAMGRKRSQLRRDGMRTLVNQLLTEMDGVEASNDGVFVLGATNQPWDVDEALRRPGRFDRTLLVLPPDLPARRAILAAALEDRPVGDIDLEPLAAATDGWSGADLAHVCASASEAALLDSVRSGHVRRIETGDLQEALRSVRPSIGPWLDAARNVAEFANEGGAYDDLLAYLRTRKRR